MGTALQLRRGTTTQHSTFTGAQGEVTVDTTKKTAVVHDGQTQGGIPLAKEADVNARVRVDTASQGLNTTQKGNARKNINAAPLPASNGFMARTASDTVTPRSLAAGSGISITNADGVLGNPTVNNTGVLSVNGQTGNVTVEAGVTSVNGMTGDVTIPSTYSGERGQVFTSSGTFTVPEGISRLKVTVVAGGGGGGRASATDTAGNGGGAGGVAIGFVTVTPGENITVTVGTGGGAAAAGGTSSFGSYCSATGGSGGTSSRTLVTRPLKTAGGVGSGGSLNIRGASPVEDNYVGYYFGGGGYSSPSFSNQWLGQAGAPSFFGSPGGAGALGDANGEAATTTHFGAGGGGAYRASSTTRSGGAGAPGVVIVEW